MKRRAPRKYKPITRQALERMAIGYLQRFPASIKRFRTVMNRKIARAHERAPGDSSQYGLWLKDVEGLCVRAGLLDDTLLSNGIARTLNRRGSGLRDIRAR